MEDKLVEYTIEGCRTKIPESLGKLFEELENRLNQNEGASLQNIGSFPKLLKIKRLKLSSQRNNLTIYINYKGFGYRISINDIEKKEMKGLEKYL